MNHSVRLFKVFHDSLSDACEEAIAHFKYLKADFDESEMRHLLTHKGVECGGRKDIKCKIDKIRCCTTKAIALVTIWCNTKGRYEVYARID